jgi:hypothetical protein
MKVKLRWLEKDPWAWACSETYQEGRGGVSRTAHGERRWPKIEGATVPYQSGRRGGDTGKKQGKKGPFIVALA